MSENKMISLLEIGNGVLIMPFLDSKEGERTVVDEKTNEISSFAFQVTPVKIESRYFPLFDDISGFKTFTFENGVNFLVSDNDELWLYTFEYDMVGPFIRIRRGDDVYIGTEDLEPINSEYIEDYHQNIVPDFNSTIDTLRGLFNGYNGDCDNLMYQTEIRYSTIFPSHAQHVLPYYLTLLAHVYSIFPDIYAQLPMYLKDVIRTRYADCICYLEFDSTD